VRDHWTVIGHPAIEERVDALEFDYQSRLTSRRSEDDPKFVASEADVPDG